MKRRSPVSIVRSPLRALLLVLVAGFAAPSSAAQGPAPAAAAAAATIRGIVVDAQDRPISGAELVIELPGRAPLTIQTGPDGVFRIDRLPAADAIVHVTAPGFTTLTETVRTAGAGALRFRLGVAPVVTKVTVLAAGSADLAREVDRAYDANKSVTSLDGEVLEGVAPIANYAALRLLPGVMNAGASGRDRFSLPTHIRGGMAWGTVETLDQYPAIDITPVAAEDGGYTAGFSSIIPSIAVNSISVATGGLGVSYGQASGGIVRNYLKRGSAAAPSSSVRLEMLSLGEGLVMADTGGGAGPVDYYFAGQSSLADYGDAYATFARPIEELRLASGLAKVGVQISSRSRWETMYVGGAERHDYFQQTTRAGQILRQDYHTDKNNHFLASRYDWRPSGDFGVGIGITQNWFHENRIEDEANGVAVNLSRRNRPQRATRVFGNVQWRKPLADAITYTGSSGVDLTWDRFEDITAQPIGFQFGEQAVYWRNSLELASLTLNGGVRVANVDNAFTDDVRAFYDAGAAWIAPVTRTRVFGSWSTGYKLNKAFYLWWGGGQFISREPAIGLRPSTTETVEAGVEQPVTLGRAGAGTIRAAVFGTRESDLFNFGNTGAGIPFYDAAATRGAELWSEWQIGRLRPFASLTWLHTRRDASTNPEASNLDLRFAPLPNYVVGFGSHVAVHPRLSASLYGIYDDGGVSEQRVNDDIVVTRFGSFGKLNASVTWAASSRWDVFSRLENVLNHRDLGFDRTIIRPDGTAQRVAGTQRDPGIVVSIGINARF